MSKFNKEVATLEAKTLSKKYRDETIWTQTLLEGETISYASVQTYFDLIDSPRTPLEHIFKKGDKYSLYTINLLNSLKEGWDFFDLEFEKDKQYFDLDDMIKLNSIITQCDKSKYGLRGNLAVIVKGSNYIPKTPVFADEINESLNKIFNNDKMSDLDKGIELFTYCTKRQMFEDGNKRTSLLSATFFLCKFGIVNQFYIPKDKIVVFRDNLINFYEDEKFKIQFQKFLKENCLSYTTEFQKTDEYKNIVKNSKVDIINNIKK